MNQGTVPRLGFHDLQPARSYTVWWTRKNGCLRIETNIQTQRGARDIAFAKRPKDAVQASITDPYSEIVETIRFSDT